MDIALIVAATVGAGIVVDKIRKATQPETYIRPDAGDEDVFSSLTTQTNGTLGVDTQFQRDEALWNLRAAPLIRDDKVGWNPGMRPIEHIKQESFNQLPIVLTNFGANPSDRIDRVELTNLTANMSAKGMGDMQPLMNLPRITQQETLAFEQLRQEGYDRVSRPQNDTIQANSVYWNRSSVPYISAPSQMPIQNLPVNKVSNRTYITQNRAEIAVPAGQIVMPNSFCYADDVRQVNPNREIMPNRVEVLTTASNNLLDQRPIMDVLDSQRQAKDWRSNPPPRTEFNVTTPAGQIVADLIPKVCVPQKSDTKNFTYENMERLQLPPQIKNDLQTVQNNPTFYGGERTVVDRTKCGTQYNTPIIPVQPTLNTSLTPVPIYNCVDRTSTATQRLNFQHAPVQPGGSSFSLAPGATNTNHW